MGGKSAWGSQDDFDDIDDADDILTEEGNEGERKDVTQRYILIT